MPVILSSENDRTAIVAERALDFFGFNYGDCFGKLIYFVESALKKIGLAKGGYVNDVAELCVIKGETKNMDTHALLGIKKPHYTLILEISVVPNYSPFVVFLDHIIAIGLLLTAQEGGKRTSIHAARMLSADQLQQDAPQRRRFRVRAWAG